MPFIKYRNGKVKNVSEEKAKLRIYKKEAVYFDEEPTEELVDTSATTQSENTEKESVDEEEQTQAEDLDDNTGEEQTEEIVDEPKKRGRPKKVEQ